MDAFYIELIRVADDEYADEKAYLLRKRAEVAAQHDKDLKDFTASLLETQESYFANYIYDHEELFANLFALSVTRPQKAKQLAPRAYQWLLDTLYEYPDIRQVLTETGLWELDKRKESGKVNSHDTENTST